LIYLIGTQPVLVQAYWITSYNASTRLGPPFFNSSAAIEPMPPALLFFSPFCFLTARQINVISIISQIDWTCWLLRFGAFVQVFFKMYFSSRQHLVFVGSTHSHFWFKRSSIVIQALVKFTRVLNTPMSLNLD
jgi:hypothetical protein